MFPKTFVVGSVAILLCTQWKFNPCCWLTNPHAKWSEEDLDSNPRWTYCAHIRTERQKLELGRPSYMQVQHLRKIFFLLWGPGMYRLETGHIFFLTGRQDSDPQASSHPLHSWLQSHKPGLAELYEGDPCNSLGSGPHTKVSHQSKVSRAPFRLNWCSGWQIK